MKEIYFNEEVFGRPPAKILYWGNTILLGTIVAILLLASLIPYPDRIEGEVIISTEQAPVDVNAQIVAEIAEVLVKNGERAESLQPVLRLRSLAAYMDVLQAEKLLEGDEKLPKELQMGELNGIYQDVLFRQNSLRHINKTDISDHKKSIVDSEVAGISNLNKSLEAQMRILRGEVRNVEYEKQRVEWLFKEGLASRQDVEKIENQFLSAKRQVEAMLDQIAQNKVRASSLSSSKSEISKVQSDLAHNESSGLFQARQNLLNGIVEWKRKYVLHAPISGTVSYIRAIYPGDVLKSDKPAFSVLPAMSGQVITAIAEMPLEGLGKVYVGQEAKINLLNYPSNEFGSLKGRVEGIALQPQEKKQAVVLRVDSWKTDMGRDLPQSQNLHGSCVIYTKSQTLLQRLFGKLWHRVKW